MAARSILNDSALDKNALLIYLQGQYSPNNIVYYTESSLFEKNKFIPMAAGDLNLLIGDITINFNNHATKEDQRKFTLQGNMIVFRDVFVETKLKINPPINYVKKWYFATDLIAKTIYDKIMQSLPDRPPFQKYLPKYISKDDDRGRYEIGVLGVKG